jgi:hypothetical protein
MNLQHQIAGCSGIGGVERRLELLVQRVDALAERIDGRAELLLALLPRHLLAGSERERLGKRAGTTVMRAGRNGRRDDESCECKSQLFHAPQCRAAARERLHEQARTS